MADTVLRLAVLLEAGIAPAVAWQRLAESGDALAREVTAATAEGAHIADAIGGDVAHPPLADRRSLAAAWRVATIVGAPLADSLRSLARALREAQESGDDVRAALAEPAGTARMLAWLPLVAVGLGTVLGFDTMTVLVTTPAGGACGVSGALLIGVAHRWTRRLVRAAQAPDETPGHAAEMLAIALSSGASVDRASALVRSAGVEPDDDCARVLRLSSDAGVPAVELLRSTAAYRRHRARVEGRLRAARLSSRLLLPLGVCTLPAFLALGVAPMLLGVLSASPLSL